MNRTDLVRAAEMLKTEYEALLKFMAEDVARARERGTVSQHLSHNLGNRVNELAQVAAKYDQVTNILAFWKD